MNVFIKQIGTVSKCGYSLNESLIFRLWIWNQLTLNTSLNKFTIEHATKLKISVGENCGPEGMRVLHLQMEQNNSQCFFLNFPGSEIN